MSFHCCTCQSFLVLLLVCFHSRLLFSIVLSPAISICSNNSRNGFNVLFSNGLHMYYTFCITEEKVYEPPPEKSMGGQGSMASMSWGNQPLPRHHRFAASLVQGDLAVAASLHKIQEMSGLCLQCGLVKKNIKEKTIIKSLQGVLRQAPCKTYSTHKCSSVF